jgi:hypothetical protein
MDKQDLIADNLNTRVSSLQARATMIYWTMLITLIGGVALIICSGYLSDLDTPTNQTWRRLEAEQVAAAKEGTKLQTAYHDNYAKFVDAEIDNLKNHDTHDKVWNWPSTVLRISIAGLLIFLTQILIQLYRFNSRLIVFYSSRRDAILMGGVDAESAREWAEIFAPANLDFGREPRHPFQEIATFFTGQRSERSQGEATSASQSGRPAGKVGDPGKPATPRKRSATAKQQTADGSEAADPTNTSETVGLAAASADNRSQG